MKFMHFSFNKICIETLLLMGYHINFGTDPLVIIGSDSLKSKYCPIQTMMILSGN